MQRSCDSAIIVCQDPTLHLCNLDTLCGIAQVQLKLMFPAADLTRMLIKRPMLLLDSEFEAVAEARRKLHAMFPEGGVDELVTQQPLLLVQDVEDIIGELERLVMRIRAYMEWQSIMVSTNVLTTFSR